jgi:hypothetical protein
MIVESIAIYIGFQIQLGHDIEIEGFGRLRRLIIVGI